MKLVRLIIAVCIAISVTACASSESKNNQEEPEEGCRQALEKQMTDSLSNLLTDTDFSLYLEAEDGRSYTFNKGASTLTTPYESASTSKWVTAVMILRLVDQGVLSLEDQPQDYILNWQIEDSDSLYAMTLADLLSFTSGLTNDPVCINGANYAFAACARQIAVANAGNGKIPGEEFNYGSAHMQVAGLMAVRAAGVAGWQVLFDRFREETGLFPNGSFDLPSAGNPRLAGGMHWQASEYADFIRAFQFGDLLSEQSKTEMMTDQIIDAAIADSPAIDGVNQDWHYGLGIWLECYNPVFNCEAVSYYSSPGAFGAYPFINTQYGFFGIVARQGEVGTFSKGKAVYDAVADLAEQWAASPESCQ